VLNLTVLLMAQDEAMFRRLRWWQAVAFRARRIANETLGFLQLWRRSIQKVEGKHGADRLIERPCTMLSKFGPVTLHSNASQRPG
jgi:hypothetical protein